MNRSSCTPATEALNRLLKHQDSESLFKEESQRVRKKAKSLGKRSSSQHMFDVTSILEASEQIKGLHSFPIIEWPTMEENNKDIADIRASQMPLMDSLIKSTIGRRQR
ncbi:unnamed protein product [Cylindrotheca closterium]|uniref:Uncharacterized protein n=1 Tax=Cylindrotheca closterium TaxID=2856 RepID=A0AAD2FJT5_9STRA|nr:unnamed protein product [Cylindrotheca closterium]